jgi:hypothetical protein
MKIQTSEKYINGGRELVRVKDRKQVSYGYSPSTRWIVWSETQQRVLSQHPTRKAAQSSFDAMN